MKILVIDQDKCGLAYAMRAQDAGHEVSVWMPPEKSGKPTRIGEGIIKVVPEWKPLMGKADMIVMTENSKYSAAIAPYFKQGFPIFGANQEAAELELDREVGLTVLKRAGIECLPYKVFTSYDDAAAHVKKTGGTFVSKPWGGNPDKSLSYVSKSPADMLFKLERWKTTTPLKGKLLLQECMVGYEMAVGGWIGPGGWSQWINENWEEKRLMNEGLGVNTGEMGTVMRYTKRSKLFDDVLKPCTDAIMATGYVGYVDMNCMVGEDGTPWPLEFTMRFGWPHFNLCMALHQGDPANWMAALLSGKDQLKCKTDTCVGVVMSHGDFPYGNMPVEETTGFPLTGITPRNEGSIFLTSALECKAPVMVGKEVKTTTATCTAGDYVLVATGLGETVEAAREAVYETAWGITWPNNRMFRTDIGKRLEEMLPELQAFGYAKGMRYE